MAYMTYGVKPDIVTMAKAMGGGMPIGAMCSSERIMNTFGPGAHGTTFGGNPVCCAAAYAQIEELLEKKLPENAKVVGEYLREKAAELPHVKEVRGIGLITGIEFDMPIANELKYTCAEKKYLLMTAVRPTVVRMVPPLIASKEDCDKAIAIMKETINEITSK